VEALHTIGAQGLLYLAGLTGSMYQLKLLGTVQAGTTI